MSSSKLQHYLELCRFVQSFLKTKVVRWNMHFPPWNLQKYPCVAFFGTDGVLLKICNKKEECCARSLVAMISHILPLKLTSSLALLIRSLSLFVSNLYLTSLDSGFILFTLTQVYSLVMPITESYHCNFTSAFSWSLYPVGAHASLILSKYPTWCRATFEPCCHDLTCVLVYPS
jgi:hypothetical protein